MTKILFLLVLLLLVNYASAFDQFNEEINIRLKNEQNVLSIIFVILLNYSIKFSKNKKRSISIKQCLNLIKNALKIEQK